MEVNKIDLIMQFSAEKLIEEMRTYFGDDLKRINHALKVLGFAKAIQKIEGGDEIIVESAAILHDIGIPEAEINRLFKTETGKKLAKKKFLE